MVYKIIYLNNEPISCKVATGRVMQGEYTYECNKGILIYALVNSNSEIEALKVGWEIAETFLQNTGLPVR